MLTHPKPDVTLVTPHQSITKASLMSGKSVGDLVNHEDFDETTFVVKQSNKSSVLPAWAKEVSAGHIMKFEILRVKIYRNIIREKCFCSEWRNVTMFLAWGINAITWNYEFWFLMYLVLIFCIMSFFTQQARVIVLCSLCLIEIFICLFSAREFFNAINL